MFSRERDRDNVDVSALLKPPRPNAFPIGLFVDDSQIRARSVYQQRAQVTISLARDLPQPIDAAARVLTRSDPERGGITAPALEDVRIAHARHQRGRGLRTNRLNPHEPARRLTGFGEPTDLPVVRTHLGVELPKLF